MWSARFFSPFRCVCRVGEVFARFFFFDVMPLTTRTNFRLAQGFSLIELLVVIFILAALGGGAIIAAGNMRENALHQIAITEMQKIKQALLQYRQDTGNFHTPAHPADFGALYDIVQTWDPASGRGKRGPYLISATKGWVDIGNGLAANGSGSPAVLGATPPIQVQGVADPFVAVPVVPGSYSPCEETVNNSPGNCLLDWRAAVGEPTRSRWGRPYLLFDLTAPDTARLVSMGPDGRYGGIHAANACLPEGDDLVLCLLR